MDAREPLTYMYVGLFIVPVVHLYKLFGCLPSSYLRQRTTSTVYSIHSFLLITRKHLLNSLVPVVGYYDLVIMNY